MTDASDLKRFQIFLASPGDVSLERKLAREAIEHINGERRFRGRIVCESVAWDRAGVALEAGMTPQQAIALGLPKPEDCDLVVVILWSRIGTPLPADFALKTDGTPYLSGTEWEYLNAVQGFRAKQKPGNIWVFQRTEIPQHAINDPDIVNILEQWDKLKTFLAGFTNPDSSLNGGLNRYETPDDFSQQFERFLRDRLDKLLETLPPPDLSAFTRASNIKPLWTESPYPGLGAYTPEQAPIYFGRGREADQLLKPFADSSVRFVAVVGVSGSGKSSLVMAGLLPRLRSSMIGNAPWIDLIIKPGERGDNPFLALAFVLKSQLKLTGQTEAELARALQADWQLAQRHVDTLLANQPQAQELLLVIDQFEELFTQCKPSETGDFIQLLEHLVSLPRVRAVATLRADFYATAIAEPVLANLLRQNHGTFPLDLPGTGAIHQMITRPAEAGGVELQDGLAAKLLDEAGRGPGAMALIAYTLNQLYEREQSHVLSIAAYERLGGVTGAIQQRADEALAGLEKSLDLNTGLPKLFAHLVEVNEQEVATRRRALQQDLNGDAGKLADALIKARLLVSGKGVNDQPTLEVSHETVLSGWDRLRLWILEDAKVLRLRRDLELVASEWNSADRPGAGLRTGNLLKGYLKAAEPRSATAQAYLAACNNKNRWIHIGWSVAGVCVLLGLGLFLHVNRSSYPPALASKALLVQYHLWPLTEPDMVRIPVGDFQMGDLNGDKDEKLTHTVRFAKAYAMGRYEVSFDEYDLFAAATGRERPNDQGWGRGNRPVINISWVDAVAYTAWLSERTGKQYRLPSEAEWEYATRAGTTTPRFWAENPTGEPDAACTYANVFDQRNESEIRDNYTGTKWKSFKCSDDFPFTAPVDQFQANAWGLYNTLGNVWEWVQDCYHETYQGAPDNGSAYDGSTKCASDKRVIRGGSWYGRQLRLRSASRGWSNPYFRKDLLGFRLAQDL